MSIKLKKGDAVKILDEKSGLVEKLKFEGWEEEGKRGPKPRIVAEEVIEEK